MSTLINTSNYIIKNNLDKLILDIYNIAKEIYLKLGSGYKEHIYVSALNIHLHENNILFNNEIIIPIIYKNIQIGYERADTIIYSPENIILEFKAQNNKLSIKEITQLKKYLKNYENGKIKKGILFNFSVNLECIVIDDKSFYYLEDNLQDCDIKGAL